MHDEWEEQEFIIETSSAVTHQHRDNLLDADIQPILVDNPNSADTVDSASRCSQ